MLNVTCMIAMIAVVVDVGRARLGLEVAMTGSNTDELAYAC